MEADHNSPPRVQDEDEPSPKKVYTPPKLSKIGTIEEITFGPSGAPGDGMSGNGSN